MNDGSQNIVLSARNISFGFKQNEYILNNINLAIKRNAITALIGKSGEGKSILARVLAGLQHIQARGHLSGEVYYYHENNYINLLSLSDVELQKYRNRKISIIFQDPYSSFDPIVTCGKQLEETIVNILGTKRSEARQKAKEIIRKFGLEERVLDAFPHQVSGGELQRVAIAISVVSNPDILIADEPVTNLDAVNKKQILDLLLDLKNTRKLSVLYISHDLNSVRYISDEIYSLQGGKLNKVDEKKLKEDCKNVQIIESALGNRDETLFQLKKLNKSFKQSGFLNILASKKTNTVLQNIDLRLRKSQILGIVGESGSGKTTLARILVGLESYDDGEYIWNSGKIDLKNKEILKVLRANIQLVFQNPANSLNYLVKNKTLINEPFEIRARQSEKIRPNIEILRLFEELELDISILDRYPGQISGGEAQRLAIARVLALMPEVIVFDEAFSSLDLKTKNSILLKLLEIQKANNLSYIFITHDIKSVRYICDHIVVLQKGEIVDEGSPEDIFLNPKSDYTRNLINNII